MHIEGEPERHGFVPVSYVRAAPAPSPPRAPAAPQLSALPLEQPAAGAGFRGGASSLPLEQPAAGSGGGGFGGGASSSSPPSAAPARASYVQALPEAGLPSATLRSEVGAEALSGSRALAALPTPTPAPTPWAAASLVPSAPGAAEEFTQLFSSHEAWIKAAAAKRGESYASLRAEAEEVRRALAESEARSAAVIARLGELEALVSQERARWAEGLQL